MTHFNCSGPARNALNAAQIECNFPVPLALIQMVNGRWNSELAMVERVVRLRRPLSLVLAETRKVEAPTSEEWDIMEELVVVLEPLNQATVNSSAKKYPTLSMVIPLVHGINRQLTKALRKIKETMPCQLATELRESIEARYPEVAMMCYQKATFLDPRYKAFLFKPETVQAVQESLVDEIRNDSVEQQNGSQSSNSQRSQGSTDGMYLELLIIMLKLTILIITSRFKMY